MSGLTKFIDQKRHVATAADAKGHWGLNGKGFRCALCGVRFQEGDGFRWVYGSGAKFQTEEGKTYGVANFKTCDTCDGPDVLERWVERNREFHSDKFWALR